MADKNHAILLAAKAALEHVRELREAWRTGALHECDGGGGTRSNRNVEVEVALRNALAETVGTIRPGMRVTRINCRTGKLQSGTVKGRCSYGIALWNVRWDGTKAVQCCYADNLFPLPATNDLSAAGGGEQ